MNSLSPARLLLVCRVIASVDREPTRRRVLSFAAALTVIAAGIGLPALPAQGATHSVTVRCDGPGGVRQATVSALPGDSIVIAVGGSPTCTHVNGMFTDTSTGTWSSSEVSSSGGAATFPATVTIAATPSLGNFTIRFNDGTFPNYFDVVVNLASPPTAPSSIVAAVEDGQTTMRWSPASFQGTGARYEVEQSLDGQNWLAVTGTCSGANVPASAATGGCTITGLTNGTSYSVRIRAIDSVGTGPWGYLASPVIPSQAPPAPTVVTGTAGAAQVALTWTAPPMTGYAPLSGYKVEYSSNGGANWTTAVSDTSSVSTGYTVTGLTNGTAYTFKVSGINAAGTGSASSESPPLTPFTTPGMVTGIGATTPADDMLAVSWSAPVSNGSAIDYYDVLIAGETVFTPPCAQSPCPPPMPMPGTFSAPTAGTCTLAGSSPSTSCTIIGLVAGNNYYVSVRAHNAAGFGSSNQSAALTAVGPPGSPIGLDDTPGNAQVVLTWGTGGTGGSSITGYKVEQNAGTGWSTAIADTGSASTSHTVTGLTNGISYAFRVSAINARGTGPASTVLNGAVPSTTPGQPTSLNAARGDTQVMLTWTAGTTGGTLITGYRVEVNDGTGWTDDTTDTGSSATTYTSSGLVNGTAYTFRVTPKNANGAGVTSAPSTPVTPVALPGTPAGLVATAGNGQVALTWTPGSGGGSSLTGHIIEASTDNGATWGTTVANTGSSVGTHTVTGLVNGTSYRFRVSGISPAGTGLPSTMSSATTPSTTPSSPTGLVATVGDQQVVLSWTPGGSGGSVITGYRIERNDGSGWADDTADTGTTSTTYAVLGLTNGTPYTFRVTAINANGLGVPTQTGAGVSPIAAPGTPPAPTAAAGAESAVVTVVAGAGGSPAGFTVTAAPGGQTCSVSGSAGSCTVSGLTAGVSHTFTATATNAAATSGPSLASNAVTPTPAAPPAPPVATPPGPPASVSVTAGPTSISVGWSPPASAGTYGVTQYRAVASPGGRSCLAGASGSGCVITGLTAGTTYIVNVQALSGAGWGPTTTSGPVVVGTVAPGAPGAPTVLAGDSRVTVVVVPPASGAVPTGYVATASPGGASCTVTGAAGSCVIIDLSNGTAYTVTVVATNEGGASGSSVPSASAVPEEPFAPAPQSPPGLMAPGESVLVVDGLPVIVVVEPNPSRSGLVVQAPDFSMNVKALGSNAAPLNLGPDGQLVLESDRSARSEGVGFRPSTEVRFTVTSTGSAEGLERRLAGSIDLGTIEVDETGSYAGVVEVPQTLVPGDYILQVTGVTLRNRQRSLFLGVTVADNASSRPGTVTNLRVTSVKSSQVSLAWKAPASDGGSPIIAYRVRVRPIGQYLYRGAGTFTATKGVITDLVPGRKYDIRVRAVNAVGVGPGSTKVAVRIPNR